MQALDVTEKIQDGVLKAIETTQSWTLGALRSTSSAFDMIKPDPSLMPLADKLPTPGQAVDAAFGFWGKLFDSQHAFVSGIVDVYMPPATAVVATTTAKKP